AATTAAQEYVCRPGRSGEEQPVQRLDDVDVGEEGVEAGAEDPSRLRIAADGLGKPEDARGLAVPDRVPALRQGEDGGEVVQVRVPAQVRQDDGEDHRHGEEHRGGEEDETASGPAQG